MKRIVSMLSVIGLWAAVTYLGYLLVNRSTLPYENGRYFDYANGTVIEEQSLITLVLIMLGLIAVSLFVTGYVIKHERP